MSAFIVIEGLDGAGTTTQLIRLQSALQQTGAVALATREPTAGPIGRIIRQTLSGDVSAPSVKSLPWMFAADRSDHLERTVEPALARGEYVVSDRYVPSSLAYQSLTLPLEDVFALNARFRVPDLLLFVRAPVDVCMQRIGGRDQKREIYEQTDALTAVSNAYDAVLQRLAQRGDPIVEIDGTQSIDDVQQIIFQHVQEAGLWPFS
ncbi:MAG: dTMP kinase [Myxococcota bacterium]|jgi:dTMP kinase